MDLENKLQVLAPHWTYQGRDLEASFPHQPPSGSLCGREVHWSRLWMLSVNRKLRNCTSWIIKKMVPVLPVLTWQWHFMASVLTILQRRMQLKDPRHDMHVDGRLKTVPTVLRGTLSLMFVIHLSTMITLLPLAQMPIHDGGTGMRTMLWDVNFILD